MTVIKGHVCQSETLGGPEKQVFSLLKAQGRALWSLSLHQESCDQELMSLALQSLGHRFL